jgi:hypothetical protein
MDLMDKDLSLNYLSHCDPRLNYEQSLGKYLTTSSNLSEKANFGFTSCAFQMSRSSFQITCEQREEGQSRRMFCWRNSGEGGRILEHSRDCIVAL